jgi:L-2-hydroxyglutarate oxidase
VSEDDRTPISWDALAAELAATRDEAEERGDADPETWDAVARALADRVAAAGGALRLGFPVRAIRRRRGRHLLVSDADAIEARRLLACAGLWADRVWAMAEGRPAAHRIVPFRGDYYTLGGASAAAVRGLIYPVPDPSLPFLGVHFTRRVGGEVLVGPNAVPALARDGYGRRDVRLRDALDTLAYPGFRRMARRYAVSGLGEIWRDLVKRAFVRDARRYLPRLGADELTFGPSGVRAQCMAPDGRLVDDFLLVAGGGGLHLLNAPSPAATACLAIGAHVAGQTLRAFDV